jgi:hypothetical protein
MNLHYHVQKILAKILIRPKHSYMKKYQFEDRDKAIVRDMNAHYYIHISLNANYIHISIEIR